MNNIEAFKNELRNYHYYKTIYEKYSHIYEEQSKLTSDDDMLDRFKLIKQFYPRLVDEEAKLDGIFTQLTGFHAIRYDKEPSSMNEELSIELKLELIEKYNQQLTRFKVALNYAESILIAKMNRLSEMIGHIESVLKALPKDIAIVCVDVYCNGKKYEDVSNGNNVYWSPSGVYWNVNRELERVLNGMGE